MAFFMKILDISDTLNNQFSKLCVSIKDQHWKYSRQICRKVIRTSSSFEYKNVYEIWKELFSSSFSPSDLSLFLNYAFPH